MKHSFNISVAANVRTGDILSVYIRIRKGKAFEVKEFQNGAAFANYGKKGELLGIELLEPCKLSVLDKIPNTDPMAKKFVRKAIPRQMVAAG